MIAVLKILPDIGVSSFDLGHHWDDLACKCSQSRRGVRGCVTTNNGDNHGATSSEGGGASGGATGSRRDSQRTCIGR